MLFIMQLKSDISIKKGNYIETFEKIQNTNLYLVITNSHVNIKSKCITKKNVSGVEIIYKYTHIYLYMSLRPKVKT